MKKLKLSEKTNVRPLVAVTLISSAFNFTKILLIILGLFLIYSELVMLLSASDCALEKW